MSIGNMLILENSKKLNILYVEDDEELRESTKNLFLTFFNSVNLAKDGEDGYHKYQEYFHLNECYYDIVITDIKMPKLDGLEMSKKIKNLNYDQAIIFVTAHNETYYLNEAIRLGTNGFIIKPIEIEQLKEVLYSTCQLVSDKKLLQKHYKQIEEENMLSLNQENACDLNYAKDILENLENNKENISRLWTDKKEVHARLEKHTIDVEYFRSHYAIKVIEYFLSVIRKDNEAGNCPVIFIMLDFFKHKNLPLHDIFIVCVLFKNTITAYLLERYTFNIKLFEDISSILDKNFEGVITNYLDSKYTSKIDSKPINEEEIVCIELDKDEREHNINYTEYILENDVYELQDLEEDIDYITIAITINSNITLDNYTELGSKITRYAQILMNYPIFSLLGKSIYKLGDNFIDNAQVLVDDREKMANITALVEAFVNDLIVWRKEIFDNNIEDPHFLDSSFFSNVDTIIMFITYDEEAIVEDNLDDMFF